METYSLLREIADSWVLLGMFCSSSACHLGLLPGSQECTPMDASMIPCGTRTRQTARDAMRNPTERRCNV